MFPPRRSTFPSRLPRKASAAPGAASGQLVTAAGPEIANWASGCLRTPVDHAGRVSGPADIAAIGGARGRRFTIADAGDRTPGPVLARLRRAQARCVAAILAGPMRSAPHDSGSVPVTDPASASTLWATGPMINGYIATAVDGPRGVDENKVPRRRAWRHPHLPGVRDLHAREPLGRKHAGAGRPARVPA